MKSKVCNSLYQSNSKAEIKKRKPVSRPNITSKKKKKQHMLLTKEDSEI